MRGLLVIEPLYNQIILGRKTQTRRSSGLEVVNEHPDDWEKAAPSYYGGQTAIDCAMPVGGLAEQWFMKKGGGMINYVNGEVGCKPRHKVGEVLYLKEPYMGQNGHYSYKFDLKPDSPLRNGNGTTVIWKNKLFMPADAGRNFIRITGIRCERLLDISDNDCVAEGIEYFRYEGWKNYNIKYDPKTHSFGSPKNSFLSLFKFANKVKDVPNIFVFAYTFEYLTNYIK